MYPMATCNTQPSFGYRVVYKLIEPYFLSFGKYEEWFMREWLQPKFVIHISFTYSSITTGDSHGPELLYWCFYNRQATEGVSPVLELHLITSLDNVVYRPSNPYLRGWRLTASPSYVLTLPTPRVSKQPWAAHYPWFMVEGRKASWHVAYNYIRNKRLALNLLWILGPQPFH